MASKAPAIGAGPLSGELDSGDLFVSADSSRPNAENELIDHTSDFLLLSDLLHRKPSPLLKDLQATFPENPELRRRSVVALNTARGSNPLAILSGPGRSEQQESFKDIASGRTISTYPRRHGSDEREGDPICDRYGFFQYLNRALVVVADGCNWGDRPRRAAETARNAVMNFANQNMDALRTVEDVSRCLARSFEVAHRRICQQAESCSEEAGTTTLCAGMAVQLTPLPSDPAGTNWAFVVASVGDCKAFHFDLANDTLHDITVGNRLALTNASDCGGRLGPVMADGSADLRNFQTYCCACREGDLVLVVSDGVHDNLHPSHLALTPRDLGFDCDDWTAVASKELDIAVENFRCRAVQQLVLAGNERTPDTVVARVIEFCQRITARSRHWMETNPGKRLPKDYKSLPGKMDHTTIVCFRVGRLTPDTLELDSTPDATALSKPQTAASHFVPLSLRLTRSDAGIALHCRTITKCRFECIARPSEITLQVVPLGHELADGERVLAGLDELNVPFTRTVPLPDGLRIDVESKKMAYNPQTGIVTIRFSLA